MASKPKPVLTCHRETHFDPATYVERLYGGTDEGETENVITAWILDRPHDIFKDGALKGKQLLDIGTGPVVYPIITASRWFDEVYLSDFSKANIEFLQKWRRGESDHMKFIMNYYARKEGKDVTRELITRQVLEKIKDVVECDVNKANPVSGTALENKVFDVITSSSTLQCACLTMEDLKQALKNISTLLKPGGHLVVSDIVDSSYYIIGDIKFKMLQSTPEAVQNLYKECGYVIEQWQTLPLAPPEGVTDQDAGQEPDSDAKTFYSVVARKV